MDEPSEDHGLSSDHDLAFQRADLAFQRAGWWVMLVVLGATATGLLGTGPLADAVAGPRGGPLWVEYQRFGRWDAPEQLRLHVGPGVVRGGLVTIWLDRAFVEAHQVEDITPPPATAAASGDRILYTFRVEGEGQEAVTFDLKTERWGIAEGAAGVVDGPRVEFRQVVYP